MASDKAMTPLITNPPQPEETKQDWGRRLLNVAKVILLTGAIVLASLWLVSAIVDLSIFAVYGHFIDNVKARLRIDTFLANALSLVLLVPFFLGVKYYLFSFRNKTRRNAGLAILLTMGVLYNLVLYFGTRNENFDPTGKASKFYALVPGGVVFSDRAGTEAKYGVPFRSVTPENIRWLVRIKEGRIESVADPAHHDWFDGVTRDPLLWYYADSSSTFHFFDGPGYAPSTGDQLQPVTPEVRRKWETKIREAATETQQRSTQQVTVDSAVSGTAGRSQQYRSESTSPVASRPPEPPAKSERERRLEEFRSLVKTNVGLASGKRNIAILVSTSGPAESLTAEQAFYGHLRSEKIHFITDVFREGVLTRGYFDEIYRGDPEMLKIVATGSRLDGLILGRMNYTFGKSTAVNNDLVSCEMGFSYKVVDQAGDVVKSDSVRVVGPGFSESTALERAIEILADQFSGKILKLF